MLIRPPQLWRLSCFRAIPSGVPCSEKMKIKEWPIEDRPREKFLSLGRENLSNAELLGLLLSSGRADATAVEVAQELLQLATNDLNALARLGVEEMKKIKGIGTAKALNIAAALELSRRRRMTKQVDQYIIRTSRDVYNCAQHHFLDLNHEEFRVLFLNRRNAVIKHKKISQGGITGTVADPKVILKSALDTSASGIVLMHNHPSGNLRPSQADISLTNKISQAVNYIDTKVIDHVIFTDVGYYSFADEGIL